MPFSLKFVVPRRCAWAGTPAAWSTAGGRGAATGAASRPAGSAEPSSSTSSRGSSVSGTSDNPKELTCVLWCLPPHDVCLQDKLYFYASTKRCMRVCIQGNCVPRNLMPNNFHFWIYVCGKWILFCKHLFFKYFTVWLLKSYFF